MERARLTTPAVGMLTRRSRLPIALLAAGFSFVLAVPAQAGVGNLLDPLVEDLPVVEDVVAPVVEEVVDPAVETIVEEAAPIQEVVAPSVPPAAEEVVQPVVDELLPPVDEVVPPVDGIVVPPVIDENPVPPIAANQNSPESGISGDATDVLDLGSFELAQSLQAALTRSVLASPTVSGPLVDSSGSSWLLGLTGWLRSAGGGLVDLLAIPLKLLELLGRALLTAGSGLVAPASLAIAFTLYAVRDERRRGFRKPADLTVRSLHR